MTTQEKMYPSDVAFSASVKAVQTQRGSRDDFARVERGKGWQTTFTPELRAFIAERDSCYLGTASAAGQPYIQHRGGPRGFLRILDDTTMAFADFHGNRQYVTTGNLLENDRAFIFLMDYVNRRRIKLWGSARATEDDVELMASLRPADNRTQLLQVVVFKLEAWDMNCNQHIPRKYPADEVNAVLDKMRQRILELEAEVAQLRGAG